jgi:hypothetical protein
MYSIERVVATLAWVQQQRQKKGGNNKAESVVVYKHDETSQHPQLFAADVAKRLYACKPKLPRETLSLERYAQKVDKYNIQHNDWDFTARKKDTLAEKGQQWEDLAIWNDTKTLGEMYRDNYRLASLYDSHLDLLRVRLTKEVPWA